MNLLVYLLKVILVSGIFFGYYRLFLRNKRFHHYNRFFLLSALLLSIVLPFIRIPLLYQPENPVNDAVYRTVSVINTDYGGDEIVSATASRASESVFTLINSIYLVYAIGVLFLLTLVIKSLLYIGSLRKRYPAENITSLRFYNTHEPGTPFSFFRSIFWNDQLAFNSHEGQQIFRHELFHVQHRHSADRLWSELITAVFWFNPFFHLIKKELKAIHEFLADQFAVSDSDRYAYATLLVQQALDAGKHAVTNHFFQNHIKRRIAMITQFQQSNYGYWSRVMILPVSLILFFAVTLYAKKPATDPAPKMAAVATEHPRNLPVKAAPVLEQTTDTIPEKEAREREMQRRQAELESIRKKMQEHEIELKKARMEELDEIKKKMQEHELLTREQEMIRKKQQAELAAIRKEMLAQQQQLEKERQENLQHLEKEMREMEMKSEGKSDPKLEEARKKIKHIQEEMKNAQENAARQIQQKQRELESRSHEQLEMQKHRQMELENLKAKLKEREADLRNEEKELREQYKKEMWREEQEKNRRIQEREREKKDQQREEQEKRRKEKENKKKDDRSGLNRKPAEWAARKEDWRLKNEVFTLENKKEDKFQFRNTISFEKTEVVSVSHHNSVNHFEDDQDTIPGRKSMKRETKSSKPTIKAEAKAESKVEVKAAVKAEVNEEPKEAIKAKPAKRADKRIGKPRTSFLDKKPRKPSLAKVESKKSFLEKRATISKPPKKPVQKFKKLPKVKPADGSGKVIDGQEESVEEYSTTTVTGEK